MRLGTPTQIAEIERRAEKDHNISPEILMENAGSLSAREIQTSFLPELQRGRVAILCGPGNNGADGMVAARHLVGLGFLRTEVFLVGEGSTPLHKLQHSRIKDQNIKINQLKSVDEINNFDFFIDALFGIGVGRPLNGIYLDLVSKVNSLSKPVVSLDIPSGLDAMNGKIWGACIRSQLTLTFGLAKPGLYSTHGDMCGLIRVIPIGLPVELLNEVATTHFAVNERWARRCLPMRKKDSNKFDHGRLYVVAGSPGTWGAAALCCQGAYRMGAGYVTLVTEKESAQKYLGHDLGPEVLLTDFSNSEVLKKADAIVLGPGTGRGESVTKFLFELIESKFENVLIDADGLNLLSEMNNPSLPPSWILTPHTGEMSRLLKLSSEEIENDRLKYASEAAKKFGCHVLLKGFRSILANKEGSAAIVVAGNAALAKAGTGDVLSGFIGALLAQGLKSFSAATTGAFIHARISDTWVKAGNDIKGLVASDLIDLLPAELNRVSSI